MNMQALLGPGVAKVHLLFFASDVGLNLAIIALGPFVRRVGLPVSLVPGFNNPVTSHHMFTGIGGQFLNSNLIFFRKNKY